MNDKSDRNKEYTADFLSTIRKAIGRVDQIKQSPNTSKASKPNVCGGRSNHAQKDRGYKDYYCNNRGYKTISKFSSTKFVFTYVRYLRTLL